MPREDDWRKTVMELIDEEGSKMNLSGSMLEILRQCRDLDKDDTSQDAEIHTMSPGTIVRECTAWKLGDPYWATIIAEWMRATECSVDELCL